MIRQRHIFGRRWLWEKGKLYKVELRHDGLWIREHRKHTEWPVPMEQLLRLCQKQPTLFPDDTARLSAGNF